MTSHSCSCGNVHFTIKNEEKMNLNDLPVFMQTIFEMSKSEVNHATLLDFNMVSELTVRKLVFEGFKGYFCRLCSTFTCFIREEEVYFDTDLFHSRTQDPDTYLNLHFYDKRIEHTLDESDRHENRRVRSDKEKMVNQRNAILLKERQQMDRRIHEFAQQQRSELKKKEDQINSSFDLMWSNLVDNIDNYYKFLDTVADKLPLLISDPNRSKSPKVSTATSAQTSLGNQNPIRMNQSLQCTPAVSMSPELPKLVARPAPNSSLLDDIMATTVPVTGFTRPRSKTIGAFPPLPHVTSPLRASASGTPGSKTGDGEYSRTPNIFERVPIFDSPTPVLTEEMQDIKKIDGLYASEAPNAYDSDVFMFD
ncbi:hypothetical protein PCE1_002393 [Barthelona sp. PCE]